MHGIYTHECEVNYPLRWCDACTRRPPATRGGRGATSPAGSPGSTQSRWPARGFSSRIASGEGATSFRADALSRAPKYDWCNFTWITSVKGILYIFQLVSLLYLYSIHLVRLYGWSGGLILLMLLRRKKTNNKYKTFNDSNYYAVSGKR